MLKNRALQTAKFFFDKMALEGKKLLIHLYNAKIALTDDLYPSKAAELLLNNDRRGFILILCSKWRTLFLKPFKREQGKRKKKKNKNSANTSQTAPGKESHRLDRVRQPDGLGPKQQHVQELDHAEAGFELAPWFSLATRHKPLIGQFKINSKPMKSLLFAN